MDVTILYYTSSREEPKFERFVLDNILSNKGDLPLVSVSQKPLDFGENICVGEQNKSYFNEFRQILIGLDQVKTQYVLTAESDCVQPPEYFTFRPSEPGKCYRYDNVWLNAMGSELFYKKGFSDGVQLIDKDLWRDAILKAIEGQPEWDGVITQGIQPPTDMACTWTGNPAISFKTKANISKVSWRIRKIPPVDTLPYWGTVKDINDKIYV